MKKKQNNRIDYTKIYTYSNYNKTMSFNAREQAGYTIPTAK